MSWSTVYVKGKEGFKEAIQSKLDDSWLLGAFEAEHNLIMFWLADNSKLRDFKMAIGSKLVFKYRLHFIINLAEYIQSEAEKRNRGLSPFEKALILEMVTREKAHTNVLRAERFNNPH